MWLYSVWSLMQIGLLHFALLFCWYQYGVFVSASFFRVSSSSHVTYPRSLLSGCSVVSSDHAASYVTRAHTAFFLLLRNLVRSTCFVGGFRV